MVRGLSLVGCLVAGACLAQGTADSSSRTVLGVDNELLAAGAEAIRARQYDDGIRLTVQGLERPMKDRDRSAGLSNLCAAFAAKNEPDRAIEYCSQAIELNAQNWRAYSNRSFAYYLKGQYVNAHADLERAESLSPGSRQIAQIRGMINERNLKPSVTMEEHR